MRIGEKKLRLAWGHLLDRGRSQELHQEPVHRLIKKRMMLAAPATSLSAFPNPSRAREPRPPRQPTVPPRRPRGRILSTAKERSSEARDWPQLLAGEARAFAVSAFPAGEPDARSVSREQEN